MLSPERETFQVVHSPLLEFKINVIDIKTIREEYDDIKLYTLRTDRKFSGFNKPVQAKDCKIKMSKFSAL